ncbi:hypothetical protein [Sansalvadorimonas verongulae]|uniref:hypothetical protein n=1 Tax=Sansalvadorimonas verongulae TaxID=2172824 RepID=UPI0012BB4E11|nr:hypothetical protein [Sansalvadorimonas verongulae]MTI14355.1 hypothetical protein [Sansalvadorimonas verongulae]
MTLTQYLIAWTVYITAAIGCLVVWGRMTAGLNPKLASWLRFWAASLVLTPGFTDQDMTWFSPATLAMIYDGLTHGPESMVHNGIVVVVSLIVFSLLKLLFFSTPKGARASKNSQPTSPKRTEPNVSADPS